MLSPTARERPFTALPLSAATPYPALPDPFKASGVPFTIPSSNFPFTGEGLDPKFMRRAIELSIGNVESGRGGPFGAVVVKDGNVVREGVNQVLWTNDPSAHAEVVAIREACR